MSNGAKNRIVPKLRFPEFRDAQDWKMESLGNVYSFISTNSFTRDDLNYEGGTVKNIHYGDIHTKFATLFDAKKELVPFVKESISLEKINSESYCIEGDVIFADASEDLNDIGKCIEIVSLNDEKVLSGMHTLHARQKERKLIIGFAGHLFMSEGIRKQIQREAQGAKVLGISSTRLSNTTIYYPENKIEQQKITSCLSSCDDLIAAHTQKLDALKVYRKGLMQHLFPAAGEKVPSLRFAEFKSSGDWKEDVLCGKEIAFFANEKLAVEKLQLESYVSTENLLADYGGKTTALKLPASGNFTAYKKGDVLFSNIRPYLKKVWFADDQGAASNDVIVIRSGCRVDATFLSFVLKNDYFISFIMKSAEGVKMPRGDKDVIKNFPLTFPSHKEQQKIAFCLTSVDNMITALSEKIALLREHKKGLMQGLFPHIEERN